MIKIVLFIICDICILPDYWQMVGYINCKNGRVYVWPTLCRYVDIVNQCCCCMCDPGGFIYRRKEPVGNICVKILVSPDYYVLFEVM